MPISISCDCGRSLRVKDDLAGRKIRCPECAAVVVVPAAVRVRQSEDAASEFLLADSGEEKAASSPQNSEVKPPALPAAEAVRAAPAGIAKINNLTKKMRKRKSDDSRYSGIAINPQIITGLLMMIGAAVWFFVGLGANRIFFYPPILFVLGIGTVVKGFMGGE